MGRWQDGGGGRETGSAPGSVGATCILEGGLSFAEFRGHLASRLHLVPRYRQRVMPAPFNISRPVWEGDPGFDVGNHVFRGKVDKAGTEGRRQVLTGRIFTGILDRNKPLWEIYVVEGLSDKRTGIILKVHHCMVDGVGGIGLAYIFLDVTAALPPKAGKPRFNPGPLPEVKSLLSDAVWDNSVDSIVHWVRFGKNLKEFAEGMEGVGIRRGLAKFAGALGGFLLPFSRMPFNGAFSGERLHVWREYSYSDARAIRAMCGGTLNDVVLTILAGAVRHYLEEDPENAATKGPVPARACAGQYPP